MYEKDLEAAVKGEVHGFYEQVLVALLNAGRKEASGDAIEKAYAGDASGLFDQAKAVEQAAELYNAGEG